MKGWDVMLNNPGKWQRLLEATRRLNEQAGWNWMMGDDIFGVQNPETGEIGYCVVMGSEEEVFGLAMYLGSEGLEFVNQLLAGYEFGPDFLYKQKCLTVTFEDRQDLDSEDYKLIKDLGVKFHGKKQWPQFRSYQPGYFPWFIDEAEADFLILALEQALWVTEQVKVEPDFLLPEEDDDAYYVRIPEPIEGELCWRGEWVIPEPYTPAGTSAQIHIDELRLHKIKRTARRTDWVWEAGSFYSPIPVQEEKGKRPFMPLLFLCIDQDIEQIIHYEMIRKKDGNELINALFAAAETHELLPAVIQVSDPYLYELYQPVIKTLGCKLILVDELEAFEGVKEDMFSYMNEC